MHSLLIGKVWVLVFILIFIQVESSIEDIRRRKKEAGMEEKKGKVQLKILQERTRELQREVEKDISQRYKGRTVMISGI